MTSTGLHNRHPVTWLALAHFANDFFSGILGLLLAAQADQIGLSKTQIGIASGLYLSVSIAQPMFGWITDRTQRPAIMMSGPLWTALGMLLCGLSTSFPMLIAGVLFAGVGNAMFHPIALTSVRALGGSRKGKSVAVFMLGGNSGFAIAPFITGFVLEAAGPRGITPLVAINFVLVPMILWRLSGQLTLDVPHRRPMPASTEATTTRRWYQGALIVIGAYMLVVLLRGLLHQGLVTYMPVFFKEQGRDLEFAGIATSFLLAFGAVGSYVGASLSDRFSRSGLIALSIVPATPLVLLLIHADGVWIFALNLALGFLLSASWPILLLMGQEVFPGGANGASGLAFGWGFICSAMGNFLTGILADAIGLQNTFQALAFLPIPATILLLMLPHHQKGE